MNTLKLPEGTPESVVKYNAIKTRHEQAVVEANAVFEVQRQKMWDDSKALGKESANDFPEDHPIQIAWKATSRTKSAAGYRREKDIAYDAMSTEEAKLYHTLWTDWVFSDEHAREPRERVSPSGKYKLVITDHMTSPGCWDYTRGKVYRIDSDQPIATIGRNYSSFLFAWVESHAQGDFLVGGESYMGQTIVDLRTGEKLNHKGQFCWASIYPSPKGTLLAVEGCYWGGPYEVVIFDFTNPMSNEPPVEIHRDAEHDAFCGWVDEHSCKIGRRFDVVNLPGHPLHGKSEHAMSLDELKEVEREGIARGFAVDEDFYTKKEESTVWLREMP